MALTIDEGLIINSFEPVDSRFVTESAATRRGGSVSSGYTALTVYNTYEGLVVYQEDTDALYVLTNNNGSSRDGFQTEANWKRIDAEEIATETIEYAQDTTEDVVVPEGHFVIDRRTGNGNASYLNNTNGDVTITAASPDTGFASLLEIGQDLSGKVDVDSSTGAINESAAAGKVISAITVNTDGLVTSASAKTLIEADIPDLAQSKITGLTAALDGKVDEPSGVTSESILTWDGSNSSTVRLGALATMDSISVSNTTTYDYTDQSATINTLSLALAELYDDDSRIHQQGDIAIVIWNDGTNNHTETLIYTGETQTTAAATVAADWTDISADLSGKVDVDSSASAETIAAAVGSVLSSITVNSQGLVTDVASKELVSGDIPDIAQSQVTGLTAALDGKVDEDSSTSAITRTATDGSVINSITVNADGLVTAATQKELVADDIPDIAQSQVTGLTASLDGKVDEDSSTNAIDHEAATGEVIDSITVNADGLVTAATQKSLLEADIPTLSQSKITNLTNDLNSKVDEPSGVTAESILTWDGTNSSTVRLGALASMDSINVSNTTTYNYTAQSATINTLSLALAALYAETSRAHEQGDIAIVIWSDGTNSHTETLIFTGTSQTTAGTSTASDWTDISADISGKVDVDSTAGAEAITDTVGYALGSITVNHQGLVTAVASKAITATEVGLGNVDNTSDANKPVSDATQTALDAKLNLSGGTMSGDITFNTGQTFPGTTDIVNGSADGTHPVPSGAIFWHSTTENYWNTTTESVDVVVSGGTFTRPSGFERLSGTDISISTNTNGTLSVNSSSGINGTIPLATAVAAGILRLAADSGLDIDSGQLNLDIQDLPDTTAIDNTDTTEATADFLAVHTTVGGTPRTYRINIPTFIDQIQGAIDLAGERITSGEVAANRIADLSAGKITSGEFDDARIPNLAASKITSGEFDSARIPDLAASKITSGEFDSARIPDLAAGKITSGEFDAGRIPDLNASKITAGEIDDARIPSGITRDSEFTINGNTLTTPAGNFTPDVGEDNQTITAGDGLSATNSGTSEDITINVDLSTDSGLAFYSGELGASFQDETISLTSAGRNLIARGNHNHNGQYVTESSFDHFSGTLDSKLEQLIEDLSTNEGRVREQIYEHFEVAADIFTVTAVTDPSTGETENEVSINTSNLPSGVNHLPGTGQTLNRSANGVIFGNDAANQVVINSHIDTFSTVARQGNNYESSTTIADALETAFNNLPSSSQDSAEVAILLPFYTAGSGSFETNECLIVEVPVNAGSSESQQVDWTLINGIIPVQAQFDEVLIFFFDGQLDFRTHAAGTVRISLTQSGDYENLAERIADANDNSYDLFISFTDRDGVEHNERVVTTGGRPNFREWDHWGPYLDLGIRDEGGTTFRVEPGSYVHLYETQSITIHETPHRVNMLDTANTTGATELNWYAPTESLATSTDVSSSTTELTIRSGSSSTLTANNRYFVRTGNDIGGLDAGEWYSARYLRRSTDSGGTEDGYIFDTIRDVHGDSVSLTAGTEIETSLWQVFNRTAAVTRGSGGDVIVQDEGTALTTAATTLNFTGAGVTASGNGAIKTIEIPGGGEIDNDATAVRAAIFRGRNNRRAVPRSNAFVRNVESSNITVTGSGDGVTWNLAGIPSTDLTETNFPASSSTTNPDVFWGVNVTSSSNPNAVPLGLYHAHASDAPNNIIEDDDEIRLLGAQPIDGTDYDNPTVAASSCDYQIIRLTEIDEVSGGSTVNVDSSEVTNANFVDTGEIVFRAADNGNISADVKQNTIDGNELDIDFSSVSAGTPQYLRVDDEGGLSLTSSTSTGISSLSIDTDEDGTSGTLTSSDGSFGIAGDGIVQTEVTGTDVVVSLNTSSFSNGDILSVDASGNIVAGTATTVESTENTFVLGGRAKRRNVDSGTTYVTSYVITDGGGSDLDIEVVTNSRARGSNTIQERRIGFNGVSFNQAILNVGFFHGLRTDTSIAASEISQIAYIRGEVGYNNTGTAYTDTSVTPRPNADGDLELQGFTDALRLSAGLIRFRATASVGNFAANTDYTASMTRVSQTMTLTNIRDANGDSIAHGITSTSPSRSFTAQNIAVENEGYFGAIQGTAPYTYTNK